jgi:hypothetical protein
MKFTHMSKIHTMATNYIIEDKKIPTKEKIELLKECIELGVDINKNNSDMLFSAINELDGIHIIKFLIDNGIDIHVKNDKALFKACLLHDKKFDIIKLLLESGAKVDAYKHDTIWVLSHRRWAGL